MSLEIEQSFYKHINTYKRFYKPLAILSIVLIVSFLLTNDVFAVTTTELRDEIEKTEKLMTGGFLKIGMLAAIAFSLTMGVIKHNPVMLITGGAMLVGGNMLIKWITTTFTALI